MKAKDLRNSILQLAVQGKLVPQDPNDEPASILLERIRTERAKLVKEKKIKAPKGGESIIYRGSDGSHYEKRGKGEPICIDGEIPFDIPINWEWCRFETVVTIASNLVDPEKYQELPHIAPDNIEKGTGVLLQYRTVGEDKVKSSNHLFHAGQILYSKIRPALRKAVLAPCDGLCSADMYPLSSRLDAAYLLALLLSDYFTTQTLKDDTRVKMPKTNQAALNAILVPVPPLLEQARIGKCISVISTLVDEYGVLEANREELDEELFGRLRKSILQMAVQGKLVGQDPDDEPASALLDRIRAERAALVKAKKLKAPKGGESVIYRASDGGYYEKRGKDEPVCIDDEIPFDIPDSWTWVRLPEIADLRIGKTPSRHDERYWANGNHPWFSISDMHDAETLRQSKETITDIAMSDCFKAGASPAGTLLMSFKLTIGKTSILGVDAVHNEAIVSVLPHLDSENALRNYLLYALPFAAQNGDFKGAIKGSTLNSKSLNKLLIPLPPPQEQKRIVSALAELLPRLTNQ